MCCAVFGDRISMCVLSPGGLGRMADDQSSRPLARRVPGASRAGPSATERPVLPAALLQRMQAAVSAAHAQAAEEQRLGSEDEARREPSGRREQAARHASPSLSQGTWAASNGRTLPFGTALPTSPPPTWSKADDDTSPLPRLASSGAIAVPDAGSFGAQPDSSTLPDRGAPPHRAAGPDHALRRDRSQKRDRHAAKRDRAARREQERAEREERARQERERAAEQARQRAAEPERQLAAEQERERAAEREREQAEQRERERAAAAVTIPADPLEGPRQSAPRPRYRRRYRPAALVASALVLVAGGSLAVALSARGSSSAPGHAVPGPTLAVAWVAHEVSRTATVACDPAMCRALEASGVEKLLVLGPATSDPRRSQLIIATAAVRQQFGASLGSAYAPSVIASFGSGSARVDIRVVAPNGPAAYEAALNTDVQNRKQAGAELLGSPRVVAAASARRQMLAGQVSSQLLIVMTSLATLHPVDILAFGDSAPGASAGIPLRSAELSENDGAAVVQKWLSFLRVQKNPYLPAVMQTTRVDGQPVLLIEFAAPTPLGLFAS